MPESIKTVMIDGRPVTLARIVSKTQVGPRRVYDIEVGRDHNYFVSNVSVHNCMLEEYANRTGEKELFNFGEEMLLYRHRRLFFALASANKRTLRGDTRIAAIIDELGLWRFDKDSEDKERASGPEVYASLENQMLTIEAAYERNLKKGYSDLPKPHMCAISSPMDINDTIMMKYREAEGDSRFTRFKYCVSGDTLISTNKGVVRIDSMVQHDLKSAITVPVKGWKVIGSEGAANLVDWHYTGVKPMVTVATEDGHKVTSTRNHRYLVLRNGCHVWVRASSLLEGDFLCVNSQPIGRSDGFFPQRRTA